MKTKLLVGIAVVMTLFASCKKGNDVMGIIDNIAVQNMNNMYCYWQNDTTQFQTMVVMYDLSEGVYKKTIGGANVKYDPDTMLFTWGHVYDPTHMVECLTIVREDGSIYPMYWAHNQLRDTNGIVYPSSVVDMCDRYDLIRNQLQVDGMWMHVDSTFYYDTIVVNEKYLQWSDKPQKGISQDSINSLRNYFQNGYIKGTKTLVKDTIAWYNRELKRQAADTIRVLKEEPEGSGLYNVLVPTPSEKSRKVTTYPPIGNKTKTTVRATYSFAPIGQPAMLETIIATYSRDCYKNPTSPTAIATITTSHMEGNWMLTQAYTARKFDLLIKGTNEVTEEKWVGGKQTTVIPTSQEEILSESISEYTQKDTTMLLNGYKVKLMKK